QYPEHYGVHALHDGHPRCPDAAAVCQPLYSLNRPSGYKLPQVLALSYIGFRGYCIKCARSYSPPDIRKYERRQLYGHTFKAWIVYQRVALRLPYSSIVEAAEEYFGEKMNAGRIPEFIQEMGHYYTESEKIIEQILLKSPFIHADETKISIQGVNQYVWVFT